MIALIDNYDSFVHNLARYLVRLGAETTVVRNDALDFAAWGRSPPAAIVVSPGPCAPRQAGGSLEAIRRFAPTVPILGVCLGHQAIGEAYGGRIVRAPHPVHGRASPVRHGGHPLFAGLPNPFPAGRYHSLAIDPATLPACLEALAWSDDGVLMAVAHRDLRVYGVQFHPESILTTDGLRLLSNFLRLAGLAPLPLPAADLEGPPAPIVRPLPQRPVTF